MRERLLRQSVWLHSQPPPPPPPPRKLCVNDESLDSLGWSAMVPPLFWVPRIRVEPEFLLDQFGASLRWCALFAISEVLEICVKTGSCENLYNVLECHQNYLKYNIIILP